jgi:2-keto-4-pentenoate hydratase
MRGGGKRDGVPAANVRAAAIVYAVVLPLAGIVWWMRGAEAFFATLFAGLVLTLGAAVRPHRSREA